MKRILILLLVFCSLAFTLSQSELLNEVVEAHQGMKTLKASFIQEKEDELLLEKSTSTGVLKYDKEHQKLLWQIESPQKRTLLIDHSDLKIKEGGKVKTYAMNKHKMLTFLKKIMMGTLDGTLFKENKDFEVTVKKNGANYEILMKAKSAMMKKMMPKMDLIYNPKTQLISKITMYEDELNKSVISFNNAQRNVSLSTSDFNL